MKRYTNRLGACEGGPCDHIEDDPHGDIVYLSDIAPLLEQCEAALALLVQTCGPTTEDGDCQFCADNRGPCVAHAALAALRAAKGGG